MTGINRLCLIGPHGAGKSTIGRMLADDGYWHISIGALRRLAQKGMLPSDIPVRVLVMLRDVDAGRPLPDSVAAAVIALAQTRPRIVLDGLPSIPSHLPLLDASWRIIYVSAPERVRHERLRNRAGQSARAWLAGGTSARDLQLASVIECGGPRVERIDNSAGIDACREAVRQLVRRHADGIDILPALKDGDSYRA
ncbi:AAA family ATPase [Cupriavidus basilensis]|uniref:AAA family ATPase n=1 Tax=Cupriavidus basilensis TaxID=68895 RepID=UPI0039F6C9D5